MEQLQIKCIDSGNIHTISLSKQGENKSTCPECSHNRKKPKALCFSFNYTKKQGYCQNCSQRFVEYKKFETKQEFIKPVWVNFTELKDEAVKYFGTRMIGQTTLSKMKISGKQIYFSQIEKETYALCFPYYQNNELINIKYRDARKNFKLESGAELIWYNYDAILKHKEIIITEGEIDALSFIEDGFENVISVPNGANIGKMSYLDTSIDLFDKIEKIYIATDIDEKGLELREELIRRFGFEKCYICSFNEYKDANEYLCHKGRKSLSEVIKNAKVPKVDGVFYADDFINETKNIWEFGLKNGKKLNITELDEIITWETKRLAVITATPGGGKSEFCDFVNVRLNVLYGWKTAYFSPENYPLSIHEIKLARKIIGRDFDKTKVSEDLFYQTHDYIQENFFWVVPDNDFTLDNILEKFKFFVKTKGVKIVCLDPYNKIEYKLDRGETKQDYISKSLDKMIWFAKQNDVLFQLVAHPTKLQKLQNGLYPLPTMYDISGSADFWNKTDYGISLKREQDEETLKKLNFGMVSVQKVKFTHLGQEGAWKFKHNFNNGRYEDFDGNINHWDNKSWIGINEILQQYDELQKIEIPKAQLDIALESPNNSDLTDIDDEMPF